MGLLDVGEVSASGEHYKIASADSSVQIMRLRRWGRLVELACDDEGRRGYSGHGGTQISITES